MRRTARTDSHRALRAPYNSIQCKSQPLSIEIGALTPLRFAVLNKPKDAAAFLAFKRSHFVVVGDLDYADQPSFGVAYGALGLGNHSLPPFE
jgi:hypothetical protein